MHQIVYSGCHQRGRQGAADSEVVLRWWIFFEGAKFCSETGGLKWKGSKLCNYPIFQELDIQNCQILLSQVGLRI